MAVLALVLRALGVTILLTTVLVPVVDHHALARLPAPPPPRGATAANGDPVHEMMTHHHPQGSSPAAVVGGDPPTVPTFLPTAPGRCGDAGVVLIAAGAASFMGCVLAAFPFVDPTPGRWPSLAEPPPLTPPRLAA